MKILIKGKVETVSLDRVKPAHLDNEPETGTEKQRKTQNNTKNSKNTATVRRAPALKHNSERKRAEPKAKTQTRSVAVQNGTSLATTSRHNANRVNLPKQFTPYVAAQPLIQTKRPKHQMLKTIRISPTATKSYQTQPQNKPELDEKSTLPHVQMVHALVAPNHIYCGTNCTSHNNHNL